MTEKKKKTVKDAKADKGEYVKVKIKSGDSLVRLPNRMIVVDGDTVIVSKEEYKTLCTMGVC